MPAWTIRARQHALAWFALIDFARRLDVLLDAPLEVRRSGQARCVVVLGVVTLIAHAGERMVVWARPARMWTCFQLVPLFSAREWRETLLVLLDSLPLAAGAGKSRSSSLPARVKRWVVATTLRALRADARFQRLCRVDARRALGLDSELAGIAMAARLPHEFAGLSADQYNLVWARASAFRRVAVENPQLLPLVSALYLEGRPGIGDDPVQVLAARVRRDVSPRAWRYVAGYGARLFQAPWAQVQERAPMQAALAYLRMLAGAGLPPPPTRRLARAWMTACRINAGCSLLGTEALINAPLAVLAAAARQFDAARAQPGIAPAAATVVAVASWVWQTGPAHGVNQTRAWPLLERKWRAQEDQARLIRAAGTASWTSLVGPMRHQRWQVEPLLNARDVVRARFELRNCLDRYVGRLAANAIRIFCVRNTLTGKLEAAIAIEPAKAEHQWKVVAVRGFANADVPHFAELASSIARRYSEAASRAAGRDRDTSLVESDDVPF